MAFRITGVDPTPFTHLYGLSDAELAIHGAVRRIANAPSGFPERTQLRDAYVGESLLLVNHTHQPANTPYRSSHAIFISEGAETAASVVDTVPQSLAKRLISLRAFDGNDMIATADVVEGRDLAALIARFFEDPQVRYLHAHYAKYGCFAGLVERA
ncbi:DUF1203 domain-containing protein [Silvimonas soli]|uniref:DUF1203 domain-containing protein n=1 Tax=Silvimonas soli TaxID=2980100 RepID=UPI0024B36EAD|nr:DUF1203 domain-containing protein [Silvimonas soli]